MAAACGLLLAGLAVALVSGRLELLGIAALAVLVTVPVMIALRGRD
jgi:hypothetical protein